MYLNPVLNAPLGPDGLPIQVAPEDVMEHYEVCTSSRQAAWTGLSCNQQQRQQPA
jgi:hypothetical protein